MVQDWRGVGQKELPLVLSFIHSVTCSSISRVKTALRWDFPGDPVVKTSPCKAGDTGALLGHRLKIPHALEQVNPCSTLWSPRAPGPVPQYSLGTSTEDLLRRSEDPAQQISRYMLIRKR